MTLFNLNTYQRAIELIATFDETFLTLGRLLREAQTEDRVLFEALMCLPGLGRRRGYYLIAIDRVFGPLRIDDADLAEVGWTKLTTLLKHVTAQNVHALLSLAKSHTDRQLKTLMAGRMPLKNARVVLLYLTPKQYAAYAAALIKFGARPAGTGLQDQEIGLMNLVSAAAEMGRSEREEVRAALHGERAFAGRPMARRGSKRRWDQTYTG